MVTIAIGTIGDMVFTEDIGGQPGRFVHSFYKRDEVLLDVHNRGVRTSSRKRLSKVFSPPCRNETFVALWAHILSICNACTVVSRFLT